MDERIEIDRDTTYNYKHVMEEVELINIVRKEGVEKPYSKGSKIFLADPAFYYVLEGEIGNFREAFTVFALKEKGRIWSSRNEKEADLVFNGLKLEIGGRSKTSKPSDFVIRDDIDLPLRNAIPLWILGMLW